LEVISQLRDALSVLVAVLAEPSETTDVALADRDTREPNEIFRDAYLLSRGLAFHDMSLLVAQTYQQMIDYVDSEPDDPQSRLHMRRILKNRLEDAIREVDEIFITLSDKTKRSAIRQASAQREHRDVSISPFHSEVLGILIDWELSTNCLFRDIRVELNAAEMRTFIYSPISIASVLARLIQIIRTGKQRVFEVNIENRGLSVVVMMPLAKSSIVEVLLDPFSEIYFLSQLAESAGISLIIDERGIRLIMPLQMPERISLNIDYDVLAALIDNPFTPELCSIE